MSGLNREPSVTFSNPPNPNVRIRFGQDSNMNIQFYTNSMPNKLQRWMLRKVFGIWMELI
jgi:hypothetical protein